MSSYNISRSCRKLFFFEKDGEFPDNPLYIKGSGLLCTIHGRIALVTARHCVLNETLRDDNRSNRVIATNRQIGIRDKYALFKDIYYVKSGDERPGVIGDECDLAIAISIESDNVASSDSLPVYSEHGILYEEYPGENVELFSYGFPDIAGSGIDDKLITLTPVVVNLTSVRQSGVNVECKITSISDESGRFYDNKSSLNGMSGAPVFRRNNGRVIFSGITVMASSGILFYLQSKYVAGFIEYILKTADEKSFIYSLKRSR